MKAINKFSGNIVDLENKRIFKGTLELSNGKILSVKEEDVKSDKYILPGLIDAHIHIESSMLIPSEFARLAVTHGTVATVSDPHEIANVLGINGIDFMINNGRKVPFKFYFGASSCVPATPFETAGAEIGVDELELLLKRDEIKYMSEMMNWPGVIFGDKTVAEKIAVARSLNKPVDGHAPGLKGEQAEKYIKAGITTDHECFAIDEAKDKLKYGMKILIREGSAAKNFEALIELAETNPDEVMFCSDDRHPNDLAECHINDHVKRALKKGIDPLQVLRIATLNPVKHYNLDVGLLREGDDADFIVVDNLENFNVLETWIKGQKVAENGKTLIDSMPEKTPNNFQIDKIGPEDIMADDKGKRIKVIEALDGELITRELIHDARDKNGKLISDPETDILKLVVVNRYFKASPAIGFIKNFGLKSGAIASSVAHDSHNIVAVGVDDQEIVEAINLLIDSKGGVSHVNNGKNMHIPLPVAGLMSNTDAYEIARRYDDIDKAAKLSGSELRAPYMTLSFMALLVIPALKLSDKGLFDGQKFEFTPLYS